MLYLLHLYGTKSTPFLSISIIAYLSNNWGAVHILDNCLFFIVLILHTRTLQPPFSAPASRSPSCTSLIQAPSTPCSDIETAAKPYPAGIKFHLSLQFFPILSISSSASAAHAFTRGGTERISAPAVSSVSSSPNQPD